MIWICVGYWCFGFACLMYALRACAGERPDLRSFFFSLPLGRRILVATAWFFVTLVLAPLCPIGLVYCFWAAHREAKQWEAFGRTHRDVVMEPMALNKMRKSGRAYVLENEEQIEALGFDAVNTYLYKPEPLLIESRYYLSSDRKSLLSIGHVDGTVFYSLLSYLSDGTCIETSACEFACPDVDKIEATGHYRILQIDPKELHDIAATCEQHDTLLEKLELENFTSVIEISRDLVAPLTRYSNRKYAAAKYELGRLDECPPQPEWPFETVASASA